MFKHRQAYVLFLLCLMVAGMLWFDSSRQLLRHLWALFSSLDVSAMMEYLRSFGPWAMVVSFLLMIFQALAAPLPAFLITFANAALFGWWQGALLSWFSAMVAAWICFILARWVGRETLEKFVSSEALKRSDLFFARYGKHTILICRLLPFVSFDIISYAAGLTSIKVRGFLIATGIGQLPATLVYSYVGGMLTGGMQLLVTGLLITFSISVVFFALKKKKLSQGNNS
ncbi:MULTISPECIES: TVP38/TMEM64 family protein [Hafnia]|jgi:uncharacterized membrane protein YdjX (TVP38/TMEM64 family)|uniref:TVP38/TMEM64 family membrane protein n=2 Tax=Hafnia TaxID=568 RepID=A0A4V2J798_9GAMM|nr:MULTISPECIES: TVP38/TMEM64 family protein [Hafnia]AJQ99907.1 Alkaline phosphatase like protein [Enterobacteriaceae bacterium bta3-1]EHM42066.1 SNARE-like domain protein [Hafnia alvei ATCC 51873]QQE44357.1 TVP38/TMEM64 family protein [Hafnia alvei]TBM25950.1 TVP38/TMEM64 family protein [Hafnia paralvei]